MSAAPGHPVRPAPARPLADMMVPTAQFGLSCGGAGAFIGVSAGILKSASPVTSGIMTGTQWALLGSTYWFTRQLAIRGAGVEEHSMTPTDRVTASALASIPTGCLMALGSGKGLKGVRSNLVLCGATAVGGQLAVNFFTGGKRRPREEDDGWLGSRWSPLQKLSDEEYLDTMGEKMLRIDADIALIDERIAELRSKSGGGADGK